MAVINGADKIKDSYDAINNKFDEVDGQLADHVAEMASDVTPPHGMGKAAAQDYEEGSWTPELRFGGNSVGISYATQSGKYVKIGNVVFCQFDVHLSDKGSSTGNATISGLPFAVSIPSGFSLGDVLSVTPPEAALYYVGVYTNNNILLRAVRDVSSTNPLNLTDGNFGNTTRIRASFFYSI